MFSIIIFSHIFLSPSIGPLILLIENCWLERGPLPFFKVLWHCHYVKAPFNASGVLMESSYITHHCVVVTTWSFAAELSNLPKYCNLKLLKSYFFWSWAHIQHVSSLTFEIAGIAHAHLFELWVQKAPQTKQVRSFFWRRPQIQQTWTKQLDRQLTHAEGSSGFSHQEKRFAVLLSDFLKWRDRACVNVTWDSVVATVRATHHTSLRSEFYP